MHIFYINVPTNYNYNWQLSSSASEVLCLQTEASEVSFVANSYAKISAGDCYRVTVPAESDELIFILKTGFEKVNDIAVSKYLKKNRIELMPLFDYT